MFNNNPYQNYQQPYQMQSMYQRPMQSAAENTLIRVTGLEGARAYQMAPNSTVALFDGGEDIMYIKSTDGAGFPTIKVFRFEPMVDEPMQPQTDFVSRIEFEDYKRGVEEYVKQLISESRQQKRGKSSDGAANQEHDR